MKLFLYSILGISMFACSSAAQKESKMQDLAKVGPLGTVFVVQADVVGKYTLSYFECHSHTLVQYTAPARLSCAESIKPFLVIDRYKIEKAMYHAIFKTDLLQVLTPDQLLLLKTLSNDDYWSFKKEYNDAHSKIIEMRAELAQINAFIAEYGEFHADMVRRAELMQQIPIVLGSLAFLDRYKEAEVLIKSTREKSRILSDAFMQKLATHFATFIYDQQGNVEIQGEREFFETNDVLILEYIRKFTEASQ